MAQCEHKRPLALSIYGGHGIEWCPDCGAFRRICFHPAKSGGGVRRDEWVVPKQAPTELTQSTVTISPKQ